MSVERKEYSAMPTRDLIEEMFSLRYRLGRHLIMTAGNIVALAGGIYAETEVFFSNPRYYVGAVDFLGDHFYTVRDLGTVSLAALLGVSVVQLFVMRSINKQMDQIQETLRKREIA